jgi:hypothetical protein
VAVPDQRFDGYLVALARGLAGGGWQCRAVVPAVDGGLLFALRTETGQEGVAALRFAPTAHPFERRPVFGREGETLPESVLGALAAAYARFVQRQPHPLLDFVGQDVEEVFVGKRFALPDVWARWLRAEDTRWGRYLLREVTPLRGALTLRFDDGSSEVRLRITNHDDPRTAGAGRVLHVGPLALSLLSDTRPEAQRAQPAHAVDRFVAYLLAHTTGPRTRLAGQAGPAPDILAFARGQQVGQVQPVTRQGANGMYASLFGRDRRALGILSLGDSCCRQTLPWSGALLPFDTWSYFPVATAGADGQGAVIDFRETDIIGGGERRLALALRAAADQGVRKLALLQTCVSRLIGDDAKGVLSERFGPEDVVRLDPDFQHRELGVDALVWPWAFRALRPAAAPPPIAGRVNLVGFGHREFRATGELAAALEGLGLTVGACIFPSFEEDELARFDAAELTVALPAQVVRHAMTGVLQEEPRRRWVFPTAPFGIGGTRDWLRGVLGELGRADDSRLAQVDAWAEAVRAEAAALRGALAGVTLAVTAPARFCAFLFDPSELFGVPVVDMVTELGARLDVLVHADVPVPRDLSALAERRPGVRLRAFAEPEALFDALRASEAQLLLTSIRRNRAALEWGKVPIAPAAFELGFAGALRTARTLLRAAALPVVRGYQRPGAAPPVDGP